MKIKKLPDVYVKVADYGLAKTSVLGSGTFALISHSPLEGQLKLLSSEDQLNELGNSIMRDTLQEFFNYSRGNVYTYSLPVSMSEIGVKTSKSLNCNFGVSLVDKVYKDMLLRIEVKDTATPELNSFTVTCADYTSTAFSFELDEVIKIAELGVSLKLSATSETILNKGDYFELDLKFSPKVNATQLLSAHRAISSAQTDIEYIAYDFASSSVHWTFSSEDLKAQAEEGISYLFGVFRTRDMKMNETTEDFISYLEGERDGFSSTRIVVLAQPVVYKNYKGELVTSIPFATFLSFLSSKKYYESLNAVRNGMVKGLVSLSPFRRGEIEQIYSLSYTGFRYFEGLSGIYVSEASLLSAENSDFDSVEKIRVMNRACLIARKTILESFLNSPLNLSGEVESIKVLLREIIKKEFSINLAGAVSKYDIEILGLSDVLSTSTITVKIKLMPLGKAKYITNTFTYKV